MVAAEERRLAAQKQVKAEVAKQEQ